MRSFFIFLSFALFFPKMAISLSAEKIAICQSDQSGFTEVTFQIFREEQGALVVFDETQPHPPSLTHTQTSRRVKEQITHDFWQYSNGYDFDLKIFPGGIGRFTGNLIWMRYYNLHLNCQFTSNIQ